MNVRMSADGAKLVVNESRPWLQSFMGFAFAAVATGIMVGIVTSGTQVKNGRQVPLPPAAYFGGIAFCSLFIVLGIIIMFGRSGTTFIRETREAVVWWWLLVRLRAWRHDLRRYTTVW